jgi:hypothetical protein
VTSTTPSTNAHRPRRSERVLVLAIYSFGSP